MQSDYFSQAFDEFEGLDTKGAQCLNSYWYKVLGNFSALCLGCHRTRGNYSGCSVRVGKCILTGKVPDNTLYCGTAMTTQVLCALCEQLIKSVSLVSHGYFLFHLF